MFQGIRDNRLHIYMQFKLWLEELSDENPILFSMGTKIADKLFVGDYEIYLLVLPSSAGIPGYNLAVQRKDTNVLSQVDQFDKNRSDRKRIPLPQQANVMFPIIRKLKEWVSKYGEIIIASHNPKKTEKWLNSLLYLSREYGISFNVKVGEWEGHEFYKIT